VALDRIVLGYDGSDSAKRALARAAELAGASGTVLVVTAAPLLYNARAGGLVDPKEEEEALRLLTEARALLAAYGAAAETKDAAGDAGEAIIEAAEDADADLVVVGTRRRNVAARLLLGSVSTKVVHTAPCDVLVVR
jgi:nucleotide-binding universal stress UspA family protein